MSRGFTGGRSTDAPKRSAKEMYIRKAKGQGDDKLSPEARYEKLMNEKMEDIKKKVIKSSRFAVQLPGTDSSTSTREISKAAQDVIDKLAKERAKKHAKKNMYRNMHIRAKSYTGMQGGRIDSKGRIYGPDGKYIAFVCKKSGKVKNRWGNTICKYSDSGYCEFKIARFIAWTYDKKRLKSSIYAVKGFSTSGGGVYGSVKDGAHSNNSGGVWGNSGGSSGGSVWGPSDNHGGGGGGIWGSGW